MERVELTEKNLSKLRELVKRNSGKEIIFSSDDDELNRKVLEKIPIKILLIKLSGRKDFMKQRNSGLNEVIAKIAKKNSISIGINLDEIILSNETEKKKIISRLKQNIKICARNKVEMVFIQEEEKRNPVLLKSLGLVLGMPTWMTKNL
jgi:ribonuclease P/MRP protein subunit RPP1